jgi:hypothetical protein
MLATYLKGATTLKDVEYISSSINRTTTASNTVTAPTGITDGDLLVALGINVETSRTLTYPAGFAERLLDNSTRNSVFVATKIASGESGDYAFTWSGSNENNTITLLVYRNATDSDRLIGTVTKANSDTSTALSISPINEGALIGFFALSDDQNVIIAPVGMTQRALQNASNPSLAIYDIVPNGTGVTGDKTLGWGNDDDTAGFLMQIYRG